jgi:hypothetical protein
VATYADPSAPAVAPGGVPTGLTNDEMRRWYLNQDPTAAFMAYLQGQGLSTGLTAQDKFAAGRMGNYYQNYLADASKDPTLGFYEYLNQRSPDLNGEYQNQSPMQRGDMSSRTFEPRARWVNV